MAECVGAKHSPKPSTGETSRPANASPYPTGKHLRPELDGGPVAMTVRGRRPAEGPPAARHAKRSEPKPCLLGPVVLEWEAGLPPATAMRMMTSRPFMPRSYDLKPEKEGPGLLAWDWAEARLAAARNYWIATTSADGRPHAMPVWGVWLGGAVFFSTDRNSKKGRNLAANSSVVVHLESGDEVAILEGMAIEVTDPGLLRDYAGAYESKYVILPDLADRATLNLMVRPERAFGWSESDFQASATRWEFGS